MKKILINIKYNLDTLLINFEETFLNKTNFIMIKITIFF